MWEQFLQALGLGGGMAGQVMKPDMPAGPMAMPSGPAPAGATAMQGGGGMGSTSASGGMGGGTLSPQMLSMLMQQLQPQPDQRVQFAPAGAPVRPTAFSFTPRPAPIAPNYKPLGT